jgi:outer membrane protein
MSYCPRPERIPALLTVLVAILVLLGAGRAEAQDRRVYALDQLVGMALEQSYELKMADQDILAAKADLTKARGGQYPQLDVDAVTSMVNKAKTPYVKVDNTSGIGTIVDRESDSITLFGRLDFTIAQPLYTFGKIQSGKEAAALGVEVQQAAKNKKRNEVVLQIKELYYAYLVAGQGKKSAAEADEFILDAERRIKNMIRAKSVNVDASDLYRLEAFAAEAKQFRARAESGTQLSSMALKRAVGIGDKDELALDIKELPKEPRPLASLDEYISLALSRRPEFEQLKKGIQARQKMVASVRADFFPSIFAAGTGSVAAAMDRQHFSNAYISDEFNHAYAGFYIGSTWHFDLGIKKGKLAKARAELEKTRDEQSFAEQNIPLEVARHYQDAVEAQASWQAYEKAAAAARKWIISATSNFDFGVGTAKDMFDAIDRYGKNQGEYLRALYNYHVSMARLDYAIGAGMAEGGTQ